MTENEPTNKYLMKVIGIYGSKAKLAAAINDYYLKQCSCKEICKDCRVTRQAIEQWQEVPPKRVIAVEKVSQGKVTRHQLRPDIYPDEAA